MLLSLRLNSFKMKQEISLRDALNYLLCRLTKRELSEKIGLDQWKLLVKMKDSSFTDEEKETIKRVFYDLSNQPKNDAKKIVDKFYNNSNFLIKINQQNRLLLAKTSAIIHVELLIENLIYRYGNEDFTGKPYFENLIIEIDKL